MADALDVACCSVSSQWGKLDGTVFPAPKGGREGGREREREGGGGRV